MCMYKSETVHSIGSRQNIESMLLVTVAVAIALAGAALAVAHPTKNVIYVDSKRGILGSACWTGGESLPCNSLDLALEGAQHINATIVFIKQTKQRSCDGGNFGDATDPSQLGADRELSLDEKVCSTTWFVNQSKTCKCGSDLDGVVHCNSTLPEVAILDCYCMTFDEDRGSVVAGACFYNCAGQPNTLSHDILYYHLPPNFSNLTEAMCGSLNRQGQLCGQCKDGYLPPVYSYDLKCRKCSPASYHWVIYILVAFLPLTVFLLIVLWFRISATSARMNAFVSCSQTIANPTMVRIYVLATRYYPITRNGLNVLEALYGIWNLDFFRTLIPHICLQVTTLQALALDYILAVYPLVLLTVAYFLIYLHGNDFKPIIFLWKGLRPCCACFRGWHNARSSIINAFATFLLLSYERLLSVSFDLLVPTEVFDVYGRKVGFYLYFDATVEYFGKEHLPYAIIALAVLFFLILLPMMLLLLYPMRCFQRCLTHCRLQSHALQIFSDAFQGCYKDGTEGTRDCRYFAVVYLFCRVVFFLIYAMTLNAVGYALGTIVTLVIAILFATVKPYKEKFAVYNTVDTVLMLMLALWSATILCVNVANVQAFTFDMASSVLHMIAAAAPLIYIICAILYWLCSQKVKRLSLFRRARSRMREMRRGNNFEGSPSDQLVNPDLINREPTAPERIVAQQPRIVLATAKIDM